MVENEEEESDKFIKLREEAEKKLEETLEQGEELSNEESLSLKELIHELEVHQEELEIQNKELQKTRNKLQKSKKKYTDLYNSAPISYLTLDKEGKILDANLTASKKLETSKDKLKGRKLYEYITEEDKDQFYQHLRKVFKTKEQQKTEVKISKTSKKHEIQFHGLLKSTTYQNEDDEIFCRTVLIDISERKEAENKLKTFVKAIPDLVVVYDEDGYYEEILTSKHKLLYKSKDQLLGKKVDEIMVGELGKKWLDFIKKVTKSDKVQSFEYPLKIEGNKHWFEARALPINSHKKDKKYVICAIRDITIRKEAEERKEFLNTLLRQDLGTKSQIILGYLNLLEEPEISKEHEKYLKKAIKAGGEVDQILNLGQKLQKIEETEWTAKKDINNIIEKSINSIEERIKKTGIKIRRNYPSDLNKVKGDYSLNTLITQILVTRAQIGECTKIKINAKEKENKILVTIEDNGNPLPQDIKNLFTGEPYTGETTGVGGVRYYMLREIARHNNVEIEVKKSELGGPKFNIYLVKE